MSENERRGERSQERTSSPVRLNVFSFSVLPSVVTKFDGLNDYSAA